jgi:hypothetical protein
MKIAQLRKILKEGGNVFKDRAGELKTRKVTKAEVFSTIKELEKILELPLDGSMLGSTGVALESGDIDLVVDENKISKEELRDKILASPQVQKFMADNQLEPADVLAQSGITLHLLFPVGGDVASGFVQVDLMFHKDPTWLKFSLGLGGVNSEFKGVHTQQLLASIAKARNLKWSFLKGLLNRETNEVVSKDPAEIAKTLLGKNATKDDLQTVESILLALRKDPAVADLLVDFMHGLQQNQPDLAKVAKAILVKPE